MTLAQDFGLDRKQGVDFRERLAIAPEVSEHGSAIISGPWPASLISCTVPLSLY
jgi:hypothetical protein